MLLVKVKLGHTSSKVVTNATTLTETSKKVVHASGASVRNAVVTVGKNTKAKFAKKLKSSTDFEILSEQI